MSVELAIGYRLLDGSFDRPTAEAIIHALAEAEGVELRGGVVITEMPATCHLALADRPGWQIVLAAVEGDGAWAKVILTPSLSQVARRADELGAVEGRLAEHGARLVWPSWPARRPAPRP